MTGDTGKLSCGYFAWQVKRNPSQQEELDQVYTTFRHHCCSLNDIYGFSSDEGKEMDVPKGIAKRLRMEVKTFRDRLSASASSEGSNNSLSVLTVAAQAVQE